MLRLYLIVASLVLGLQAKLVVHQYETCKEWEEGYEPVQVYKNSEVCVTIEGSYGEIPQQAVVTTSLKKNECIFQNYRHSCTVEGEKYTVKRGSCVEDEHEDRVYTCESTDPFNDDGWSWAVIGTGSLLGLSFVIFACVVLGKAAVGAKLTDQQIERIQADAVKNGGVVGGNYTETNTRAATLGVVPEGNWSVPLFACPGGESCLVSWCCTPCAVAETRRRFYAYSRDRCMIEGCCMTFWDMALTAAGIGVCMPVTSVLLTSTRGSVREARDYRGSPFNDCLCSFCCTCCTSLQLERDQQMVDEINNISARAIAGSEMRIDGVSAPEYGNDFPAGQRSGSRGGRGRRGRSRPL